MVLALVVTIVSVSAAWFSNTASTQIDNKLVVGSDTVKEFVTIKVDSSMSEGGVAIWPAKAKPGEVLKNDTAPLPHGVELKTKGGIIDKEARTAVQYIPLTFVGTPDAWTGSNDGRKSLSLSLESVTIAKYMDRDALGKPVINYDEAGKPIIFKDFKGEFCVELAIIAVSKDENDKVIPGDAMEKGTPGSEGWNDSNQIYYEQKILDGAEIVEASETGKGEDLALYMLLLPGTEYYIRATIYFNKLDEECNHELLMPNETIFFNFSLNVMNNTTDANFVDIREMGKTA